MFVTIIVFVERVPSFVRFVPTVTLPFVAVIVAFSAFVILSVTVTVFVESVPSFVRFAAYKVSIVNSPLSIFKLPIGFSSVESRRLIFPLI